MRRFALWRTRYNWSSLSFVGRLVITSETEKTLEIRTSRYGLTSWRKLKNLPRPQFVKPICWPNICDEYKKSNYSLLDLAWFKKIALVQNAFNYPLMKINLGIANKMLSNKCRNQLFRWFWYNLFFLNIWTREDKISTCFSFNYKAKVIFVIVLSFFLIVK